MAVALSDINLFFALKPPPPLCASIVRLGAILRQAHGLAGVSIGAQRLHLTLANCAGESLEDAIARARDVGDCLSAAAFSLSFTWSDSFYCGPRRCPLVLRGDQGLDELDAFRGLLRARMMRNRFAVEASFTPHLTLLWADRCVGAHPIAPIRWRADELVLIKSLVGQSRHIAVARWPLR